MGNAVKSVLVIGGAGYVGSHCAKAFAKARWNVVIFDNLSRGWADAVKWSPLIEGDILDSAAVAQALDPYRPDLVAHFAAFAYVGKSVMQPALYYRNNCMGTLTLHDGLRKSGLNRIIFSSTCASYGIPLRSPIDEGHPQTPIIPDGWSKLIIERMLEHYGVAYGLESVALRYFNAAGYDPDGEIGERHGPETLAIPLAIAAAVQSDRCFNINGIDYDTRDGTAIRDYVHGSDLAEAHVLAGEMLLRSGGLHTFNLGTGVGTTVKEIVEAANKAAGQTVPVQVGPRRPSDPTELVTSAEKAYRALDWSPSQSNIGFIFESAMKWHRSRC